MFLARAFAEMMYLVIVYFLEFEEGVLFQGRICIY